MPETDTTQTLERDYWQRRLAAKIHRRYPHGVGASDISDLTVLIELTAAQAIAETVAVEREACARAVEGEMVAEERDEIDGVINVACKDISDIIRARTEEETDAE